MVDFDAILDIVKWIGTVIVLPAGGWAWKRIKEAKETRTSIVKKLDAIGTSMSEVKHDLTSVKKDISQIRVLQEAKFEIDPTAYFVCDANGHCIEVNEAFLKIFHASEDEVKELGWLNFIHPDDKPRIREGYLTAIKDKSNKVRDTYRIIDINSKNDKRPIVLAKVGYKSIFKYDFNKKLEIGVATVSDIETSDQKLDCILKIIQDLKGTPTWEKMQEEIKFLKTKQ